MRHTIAVIGAAGNMGSAITRRLAQAGYRILISGKDQSKLHNLMNEIKSEAPVSDIEIIDCSKEASWEADLIIPAVPYSAQAEVAAKIKNVVTGKIVISLVNPLNETYDALLTDPSTSGAEELAKSLPHSKIIKAFNTVFAEEFNSQHTGRKTADVFVAGDDEDAVSAVSELVQNSGFNPVIAGKLSVSRTLENMTLMLIGLSVINNYNRHAGWKILH